MGYIKVLLLLGVAFAARTNAKLACKPVITPDTTTTAQVCEKIDCPEFAEWDQDLCSCVSVSPPGCASIENCVAGFLWSEDACECIEKCPGVVCAANLAPNDNCECEMDTSTVAPVCEPEVCKRGYYWMPEPICQCFLACDYIMQCEAGEKWDFIDCGCVACPGSCSTGSVFGENCECQEESTSVDTTPDTTESDQQDTTVAPVCERKDCERGYTWFEDPICKCLLACDYIEVCPTGKKWDFIECACVDACSATSCPNNFAPDENCECKCSVVDPIDMDCPTGSSWDQELCGCASSCDYIEQCPLGEVWDFDACGCVKNECPGVESCSENQAFDLDCNCQCLVIPDECNGYFDSSSCMCIEDGCDYAEDCPLGFKWDFDVCNCVKIECPDSDLCGENHAFDEDCNCLCAIDENFCQSYEIFDASSCSCYPNNVCDYIEFCPLGEQWSFDVCGCVANECPDFEACSENHVHDETCQCQCALNEEVCLEQDPNSVFDSEKCSCVISGCPPMGPCKDNEIFDPISCVCQCQLSEKSCPGLFDSESCVCYEETSTSEVPCIRVTCRNRNVWLEQTCECVCPPMFCEEGTIHGGDCECIPDPNYCDTAQTCDEDSDFDFDLCQCVLKPTTEKPITHYMHNERKTTKPITTVPQCEERPCIENFYFDFIECDCIPDAL